MSESPRPAGFQGYHQIRNAREDAELTHVDRGTPCGEYLRRYWQPVAMSEELGALPLAVRVLGEDLVLFRDGSGRPGLLHLHCAHRGASLEYGIVAERGIICCYHGWHYDIDGTILRAGSEPPDSPICRNVVQGAYPVDEHHGLLFAYLGPPEERPPFAVFDTERMPDTTRKPFSLTTPCNWLQIYENTQDPIHVLHLHARSSGVQFGAASGIDQVIEYQDTPLGMMNVQTRQVGEHVWGPHRGFDPAQRQPDRRHLGRSGGGEGVSALRHAAVDGAGGRRRYPYHRLALLQPSAGPERAGRSGAGWQGVHRLRGSERGRTPLRGTATPAGRLRSSGLAAAHRHP